MHLKLTLIAYQLPFNHLNYRRGPKPWETNQTSPPQKPTAEDGVESSPPSFQPPRREHNRDNRENFRDNNRDSRDSKRDSRDSNNSRENNRDNFRENRDRYVKDKHFCSGITSSKI